MKYVPISSSEPVVQYITETLAKRLDSGSKIVWLLPGGSAVRLAVEISRNLAQRGTDLTNLMVTLTDERYGAPGHVDENWSQLETAGFSLPGAITYRVLQSGLTRGETTVKFGEKLQEFMDTADYRLGFFGIGSDGHTAGIKPGAFDMNQQAYVASFVGEDFERVTIIPYGIARLDEAVAYAMGSAKAETISRLVNDDVPLAEQPAQALKRVPEFTLFTDVEVNQ